ncbi:hypothetical protein J3R82DRAFT_6260 [Butyriboletus roseoflavus]|nr:hypothetical protein J3R82DRAFT_6260 [Butyriboletus roseoflavus]
METDDDNPVLVVLMPSSALDTITMTRWGVCERHYFNLPNTKVICTIFHPPFNLLVIGFSTVYDFTHAQHSTGKDLCGGNLTWGSHSQQMGSLKAHISQASRECE